MGALERAIARPDPVHGFGDRSPLHGLERRSVGFADVLAQSVAAVAPSAAATTVVLMVAGVAGSATLLSVLVAGLLALLVAVTVSQFSRRLAAAGSLYTYVSKGIGSTAALATAASIVVGYASISVFALLGGAHYVLLLVATIFPDFAGPLASATVLVAEAALLALVLVRGIRVSSRIALIVEVVSVVIIVGFFLTLLAHFGPVDLAVLLPGEGVGLSGLAAGAMLAMTAFVGFESAATLGVEAKTPLRNIPRAIVSTVIVAAVLYLLAAYTQVSGFAALGRDFVGSTSPMNDLAAGYGVTELGLLIDLGIAASFLACAIASTTALTRVVFSLGRDGIAPTRLGSVHPRFRTPIVAISVAVPAVTAVPIVVVLAGMSAWGAMHAVIVVAATGYIVAYLLVCVAAPLFLRRIGELTAPAAAIAILASIGLAGGLATYLVFEGLRANPGVWIAGLACVAVALGAGWRLRGGVASLAGIGAYDEPVATDVLGGVGPARPAPAGSDSGA